MLNLKKGLALVLAAATAFTFAPVASLEARADDSQFDEYTTTNGIDSLQNLSKITIDQGGSYQLFLKEHLDRSQGQPVGAYRITVDRVKNAQDTDATKKVYQDVVGVGAANTLNGGATGDTGDVVQNADSRNNEEGWKKPLSKTEVTTKKNTVATTSVAEIDQDKVDKNTSSRTYIVGNAETQIASGKRQDGGAEINLVAVNGYGGDVTLKIEALASKTAETALDTQTLTISVPTGNETFSVSKTEVTVKEAGQTDGSDEDSVTIRMRNNKDTDSIVVTSDNTQVATVTQPSTPSKNGATYAGTFTIKGGEAGTALVTVTAYKGTEVKHSAVIYVTVTAGNAKLTVSYPTTRGYNETFSDDASFQTPGGNTAFHKVLNGTNYEESKLTADKDHDTYTATPAMLGTYLADYSTRNNETGKLYAQKDGTSAITTESAAERFADLTADSTSAYAVIDTPSTLTSAQPVYADGTKTIQFNASSAVKDAKISYNLYVAKKTHYVYQETTAAGTYVKQVNNKDNTAWAKGKTTAVKIAGSISEGDTEEWNSHDALQYGAIDNNGLLTLKSGSYDGVELYVVVTAKADGVTTSSFAIPINLYSQKQASIFVSDETHYAETWSSNNTAAPGKASEILYLKKGATNKLSLKTDIPSSYITVTSSDPTKVSVDSKTNTLKAVDATTTPVTITVQSSSAPEFSQIAIAQISVIVNDKDSQAAPTLVGTSVNKEKPQSDVTATPAIAGQSVVFDSNHWYVEDSSYPSGYRALGPNEFGYGDIMVTSTGHVTYTKNNGTVYVRAYTSGDKKYNPSTWSYVPVNYGQTTVDTELKVDQKPITLDVNETKAISATVSTGSSIEFTSADPTVATVDAKGVVTAVKSGTTYVTVTAKAPNGNVGESAIVAVIVKGNATITDDTVKPGKVTSLKVSNKKGAYVSVKWASQGKNINYRVYKKVGNGKWVGKNVAGSKATLSVKKGAKVQVKVKAYVKDANGKTTWGPKATKAKTFKTDKK